MRLSNASLLATLALCVLAGAASAHDDDPKLLDRQAPYAGPGSITVVPSGSPRAIAGTNGNFNSFGVTLLSWLSLSDFGSFTVGNDCWGYVSPSGREYALMGLNAATGFVEITNPSSPVIVAVMSGPNSSWHDIKVFGHYVYSVSEGGSGIQVFDVSQIDNGVVTLANTITTGGSTLATHNVAINTQSGFLYRCGGSSNGFRIYDLNPNPAAPAFVGSWTYKYVHDAQVVSYTSGPMAGKEIAFCCTGFNGGGTQTGLSILDVTDKANITIITELFWPGAGYSHQCWLSEDRQYLYLNDEADEPPKTTTTYVFDVADVYNASYLGSFTAGNPAIGHNAYVRGTLHYQANYRSGLRVYDLGQSPTSPPEVYFFDTYEANDNPNFNGLWSCFPLFPSGVVIGSDVEKGLFMWWVGPTPISIDLVGGPPPLANPNGMSLPVTILEQSPGQLVAGTAKLHYEVGAGFQTVDLVPQGGSSYSAVFPALPCGSNVAFYLSAQSANGITWAAPEGGAAAAWQAPVAFAQTVVFTDDLETHKGWTVGYPGDNATTGIWERADPEGTAAQPEDDHTPAPGTLCYVTGAASLGSVGGNDVDGGVTTLLTPVFDLSARPNAVAGYWRWYSNDQGGAANSDVFEVDVTNGGVWVNAETVGPAGPETGGGWFYHQFRVADFVTPNASVQIRFRASDFGAGSIVEACVDDFQIQDLDCQQQPTSYCTAKVNSLACVPQIGFSGIPSASAGAGFSISAVNALNQKNGLLFYGKSGSQALPFQGGFLCVKAPTIRTPVQASGGTPQPGSDCTGTFDIDFNAWIASGADPALIAGAQVWAQYWSRDPGFAPPDNTNLTDALAFTVQP
ncbi:MAG TPA: choice-of-anchor B family protein [Planctomycetota bacterium]|nr:choice-of-anchor B family protein [Planctomycetota bacterium]